MSVRVRENIARARARNIMVTPRVLVHACPRAASRHARGLRAITRDRALAARVRAECRARDPREIGVARRDSFAERKPPIRALSSQRAVGAVRDAILKRRGQLRRSASLEGEITRNGARRGRR